MISNNCVLNTLIMAQIGSRIILREGMNRYFTIARTGWTGRIEQIDPRDKCAWVRWESNGMKYEPKPEWIEVRLLAPMPLVN